MIKLTKPIKKCVQCVNKPLYVSLCTNCKEKENKMEIGDSISKQDLSDLSKALTIGEGKAWSANKGIFNIPKNMIVEPFNRDEIVNNLLDGLRYVLKKIKYTGRRG